MAITAGQEQTAFYHELGLAILQWALVEGTLGEIATFCFARRASDLTPEEYTDHSMAFFSIDTFRAKVLYADAVFQRRFGNSRYAADWKLIASSMLQSARARNMLAHNPMMGTPDAPEGRRYYLVPRQIRIAGGAPKHPEDSLFLQDIVQYRLSFFALNIRLQNFFHHLRDLKEPFDASLEQSRNAPPLQQIVDQILAALLPPPPPSQR
jgi:hypothetical protein